MTASDWMLGASFFGAGFAFCGFVRELVIWRRDVRAQKKLESRFIRSARWN